MGGVASAELRRLFETEQERETTAEHAVLLLRLLQDRSLAAISTIFKKPQSLTWFPGGIGKQPACGR